MDYDVIIIGAGPAGSTLARLLSQYNMSICLLEKRPLSSHQSFTPSKACGGLLSPDAQKVMAQLGLSLPKDILETPQLFNVRTIDFDNGMERHYQRHYLNMNREKFDRFLFDRIPDTCDRICQALVKNAVCVNRCWTVTYTLKEKGSTHHIRGRFLVAADGAHSFIRRLLYPNAPVPKRYISYQEWYAFHGHMPYYTGIFDTVTTDYYSWTIQKENALILGTAIPLGKDVYKTFAHLKAKVSHHMHLSLNEPIRSESAFIERPMSLKSLLWSEKDCIAFIGEAAGAISPSSAEGISFAMKTAIALSQAMSHGLKGSSKRYCRLVRGIERTLVMKTLKCPLMYQKHIRGLVMKSGFTAIKPYDNENDNHRIDKKEILL